MAERADVVLPYPLPDKWRLTAARRLPVWLGVVCVVVAIVLAVIAVEGLRRGNFGGGLVFTLMAAGVGLAVGVGFERAGNERGMPHLINAVVLSEAEERPPDSWIHFFRETGAGLWLTLCFAGVGFFASGALLWAGALAIDQGAPGALFVVVPLLLGALVVALAGVLYVVLRWRHASFARRAIGLSVARSGVARYYLDGSVDVFPWESVTGVGSAVEAFDEATGDFMPYLVIAHHEDKYGLREHRFDLRGFQSHSWLIYTAVRFWAEHPEHRDELSTTFAQKRIRAWRDAMMPAGARREPVSPRR